MGQPTESEEERKLRRAYNAGFTEGQRELREGLKALLGFADEKETDRLWDAIFRRDSEL